MTDRYRWDVEGSTFIVERRAPERAAYFVRVDDDCVTAHRGDRIKGPAGDEMLRLAGEVERLRMTLAATEGWLSGSRGAVAAGADDEHEPTLIDPTGELTREVWHRINRESPLVTALNELKADPFKYPAGLPEEDPDLDGYPGVDAAKVGTPRPPTEAEIAYGQGLALQIGQRLDEEARAVAAEEVDDGPRDGGRLIRLQPLLELADAARNVRESVLASPWVALKLREAGVIPGE